mmetsp:Transcript_51790/g.96390  ORF Transcript_51790/g.96390 Transcript_51790/m.96390 type:complete len:270 (+) Transcript_51790:131-940(+)
MRLRRRCGSFTTTSTPDGSANRLANTAKRIAATPASSPPASPRRSTSRTRAKQVVREAPSFNMYAYAEGCSTSSRNKHSANNSAFLPAARAASASASSFSHLPPSLPAAAAALCLVSRLRFMSFVGHSTITACRNAKDLPGTAARFTSASPSRSKVSVSLVERSEDDEAALARVGDAGAVGELEGGEEGDDDDGVEEGVEGNEAIALSCLTRAGTAAALALRRGWRASSPALASVAATAAALSVSIAAATAAARAEAAAALLSERPIGA